jgi:hypothetical protein
VEWPTVGIDRYAARRSERTCNLSANVGSAAYSPGRLITWSGAPAEGQAVTLTYTVNVEASGPAALTNSAHLSGDDGSSDATATVVVDGFEISSVGPAIALLG